MITLAWIDAYVCICSDTWNDVHVKEKELSMKQIVL